MSISRSSRTLGTVAFLAFGGCGFQSYVRPQGLPKCERVALAGITVARTATSYDATPSMYSASSSYPVGQVDEVPAMFRRMLERSGLFQFIPEAEELASPDFQALAQQYPSRAAFASDADLFSPTGYPFLTDEPRHSLIQALAAATRADSVIWGRVRFELRANIGYITTTGGTIYTNVDVILYDTNGDEAWRDSASAPGGYASAMGGGLMGPGFMGPGYIPPSMMNREAEEGFVTAMKYAIDRLQERIKGRSPPPPDKK